MSASSGWLGLLPRSTSVTVLALSVLGEIGPLNVMLIVQGVWFTPENAAHRVEVDGCQPPGSASR